MPRWASRLTLTVTDVRVERLQDISHDDAIGEGVHLHRIGKDDPFANSYTIGLPDGSRPISTHAVPIYESLWDAINGAGAWENNPWVVAISFTVEQRNIDQ